MNRDKNTSILKSGEEKFYDFIESAAHDLQAPLRKLSVLVERVFAKNEKNFDGSAKEYIERIESCIDQMKSLVNGLLELAKTDEIAGNNELCDLDKIAKQSLENLNEEIKYKQVMIEVHPLPTVYGNAIQYRQLFTNLLENAIKFSRKDSVAKIEIRSGIVSNNERNRFQLRDKKYNKIEVADNGIGFNPANDEKIFEPFVRLHPRSEYAGNGLGLSVCKKIVANHNGIIYAEGNEDHGARFILILPETP